MTASSLIQPWMLWTALIVLVALLAAWMLFRTFRAVVRVRRSRRGACVWCGYQLDGATLADRCPECGHTTPHVKPALLAATAWATIAIVLAGAGLGLWRFKADAILDGASASLIPAESLFVDGVRVIGLQRQALIRVVNRDENNDLDLDARALLIYKAFHARAQSCLKVGGRTSDDAPVYVSWNFEKWYIFPRCVRSLVDASGIEFDRENIGTPPGFVFLVPGAWQDHSVVIPASCMHDGGVTFVIEAERIDRKRHPTGERFVQVPFSATVILMQPFESEQTTLEIASSLNAILAFRPNDLRLKVSIATCSLPADVAFGAELVLRSQSGSELARTNFWQDDRQFANDVDEFLFDFDLASLPAVDLEHCTLELRGNLEDAKKDVWRSKGWVGRCFVPVQFKYAR